MALRMTSLWSIIVIRRRVDRHTMGAGACSNLDLIPLEVARSGSRPITLSLDIYTADAWGATTWERNVERTILTLIQSCGAIVCDCYDKGILGLLSLVGSSKASQLCKLKIRWSSAAGGGLDLTKHRHIQYLDLDANPAVLHYSGELGIKALTIGRSVEAPNAIRLINACSQLETLHWKVYESDLQSFSADAFRELKPCLLLSRLCLEGAVLVALITHFIAPNLSHLKIYAIKPHASDVSSLHLPITPLFPQLRHLEANAVDVTDHRLCSFAHAHPRLETLSLLRKPLSPLIARGVMATGPDGGLILPLLTDVWAGADRYNEQHREAVKTLLDLRSQVQTQGLTPFVLHVYWNRWEGSINYDWPELARDYSGQIVDDRTDHDLSDVPWSWAHSARV